MFLKIFGLFFIFAYIAKEFVISSFKAPKGNSSKKSNNSSNEE